MNSVEIGIGLFEIIGLRVVGNDELEVGFRFRVRGREKGRRGRRIGSRE